MQSHSQVRQEVLPGRVGARHGFRAVDPSVPPEALGQLGRGELIHGAAQVQRDACRLRCTSPSSAGIFVVSEAEAAAIRAASIMVASSQPPWNCAACSPV